MARRNIHQRKTQKKHKPAVSPRPAVQPVAAAMPAQTAPPVAPLHSTPLRATPLRPAAKEVPDEVRFAELPFELKRIALFTAGVALLLIVLWIFLK